MKRIYLSPPNLDGRERELLFSAFDSNWITTLGPQVDAFESEIAKKTGVPYTAALASGTSALHLALINLGVGPGDEVLCSTFTFSASANPIVYCGGTPVFIDSSASTWNMDPDLLEEELNACASRGRLPKAIIVVDLYGQCADYDPILKIAARYGVPVVEDAAEALGATYGGRPAGSFGVMGILSFNGNKIITTSGGGMLISENKAYINKAKFLSKQARDPAVHYQHSSIGHNYRLSNLLAAIGRGQLENLEKKVAKKRSINAFYREVLRGLPGIDFMPEASYGVSNCWLTCITIDPEKFGASNEDLRIALEAQNIESRPTWKPMHQQPIFAGCRVHGGAVTDELFANGLCLPSGTAMSDTDLRRVVEVIFKIGNLQSEWMKINAKTSIELATIE
jgi:dTDP-4-amino-4,6-dideoxygalactose transaminase